MAQAWSFWSAPASSLTGIRLAAGRREDPAFGLAGESLARTRGGLSG